MNVCYGGLSEIGKWEGKNDLGFICLDEEEYVKQRDSIKDNHRFKMWAIRDETAAFLSWSSRDMERNSALDRFFHIASETAVATEIAFWILEDNYN